MTLRLDPLRQAGAFRIAALVDQVSLARPLGEAVMATAHKQPLAVVVAVDGQLHAVALHGPRLEPAALEAACPGLHAAMGLIPP